ncbi:MAG TPA: cytochrome c biogenesis protein CcdA [Candidatus Methylomirabilis sp.]|nr:cytochrome c biogenesis protein CcdA [Candidatus Methylomirabilis sp.]HSC69804.1 cytochrome c biogenesis protein CcdA [Candidatus Methylomirabilis sp.]
MPNAHLNVLLAMGGGLLSFLSPCVLPLFPSYLSFIAGVSLDDVEGTVVNTRTRRAILLNSLMFILGFTLVFIALGAGATLVGQVLFQQQGLIQKIGGVFIILMGLYVAGWLRIPFLMREWRVELKDRPAGYVGAMIAGITFAAGWTPCIGPILGSILTVASVSQTASTGILMLAAYSLGFAIPFFVSSLAINHFLTFFDRFKRFLPWVTRGSGVILILLGALLVSDYFAVLSRLAFSLTPEWLFAIERKLLGF